MDRLGFSGSPDFLRHCFQRRGVRRLYLRSQKRFGWSGMTTTELVGEMKGGANIWKSGEKVLRQPLEPGLVFSGESLEFGPTNQRPNRM